MACTASRRPRALPAGTHAVAAEYDRRGDAEEAGHGRAVPDRHRRVGPGGISAAARAGQRGGRTCCWRPNPHLSNTIFRYQKGKFVMDEPGILPLRSPVPFRAGSRESILDAWNEAAQASRWNVKFGHEVSAIKRRDDGLFELKCGNGAAFEAQFVIPGIGLQGNIHQARRAGRDLPFVTGTSSTIRTNTAARDHRRGRRRRCEIEECGGAGATEQRSSSTAATSSPAPEGQSGHPQRPSTTA